MRTAIITFSLILLLGCQTEEKETTTKGKLHIFIPEPIAPAMVDEVQEFLNLYRQSGAQVTYTIVSSEIAVHQFVYDTARIGFLTRSLTTKEKELVKKVSPDFNEIIIGYDGIVAAVHPQNNVKQLTTTDLQKILTKKITRWNQLATPSSLKGDIHIYCQDSSDGLDYLTQRLAKQTGITAALRTTTSNLQTLKMVENDPNAIGFVALGWLDSAKSTAKILNLGRTKEDTDTTFLPPPEVIGKFYSPDPAFLYLNYYPLKRALYMYTRGQVNLAAGFGTYVATAEGQKLFLKHGLLPGTQKIKLRSPENY